MLSLVCISTSQRTFTIRVLQFEQMERLAAGAMHTVVLIRPTSTMVSTLKSTIRTACPSTNTSWPHRSPSTQAEA